LGKTRLEKILSTGYLLNHLLIRYIPFAHYLSCNGRLIALSKKLYVSVTIPESVKNNDAFLFFFAKFGSYSYNHLNSARVFFQSPQKLAEHFNQSRKFQKSQQELQPFFSQSLKNDYQVPTLSLLKAVVHLFLLRPLRTVEYFGVLLFSRISPPETTTTGVWETDTSTKKLPKIEIK
jgi:hypothetical protein